MARIEMQAQRRMIVGKKVARLRRAGQLPGVVYGPVMSETVQVTVDHREFARFYREHGHATLFDLVWDGGSRPVFIRRVQNDPVRRNAIHVDFFAPNLRQPITAMTPLALHNPNPHAAGVMTELFTQVEVEATPEQIPTVIDVDIFSLQHPGDAIRIGDLKLPEGVRATGDADTALVTLTETRAERSEDLMEQAEAEAAVASSPEAGAEDTGAA
ncbi:MAG: 50S ribosomal protein L25 [Thermomicrobiales bacterium]|nr:50S ribosomal protein L25 [Thermomicrobiales bacterium]